MAELRALVENTAAGPAAIHEPDVLPLPPLDGLMELWVAGVTYERSREARVEESTEQSVYERIYDAERPELFFTSPPWRVVTDGEPIAVRDDSALNVPEPELALVLNRYGETDGYLVADDVSSRSIEGENPLYLPQAKIYAGSAAVSSAIVPAWEIDAPDALDITMAVWRDGEAAYQASTSTAAFHRTPQGLVDHLWRSPLPRRRRAVHRHRHRARARLHPPCRGRRGDFHRRGRHLAQPGTGPAVRPGLAGGGHQPSADPPCTPQRLPGVIRRRDGGHRIGAPPWAARCSAFQ